MGQKNSKSKSSYKVATDNNKQISIVTPVPASVPVSDPVTVSAPASAATVPAVSPPLIDSNLVPEWINETQFVEILTEHVPQFSKIQNFRIKPALGAGENYTTLMLRVSIDVELTDKTTKSVTYMMKVAHDFPEMQQMLAATNFFTIENEAYINLIPNLEQLYKAKGLDITFAPRAYLFKESVKKEPKLANTVLMYDLGQDGYKNANRIECFNFEQTKFILRKMAQYHAAGAHYENVEGHLSDLLLFGMFGKSAEASAAMIEAMIMPTQKLFLNNLKYYKDCEKYHNKLELFSTTIRETFVAHGKADPNEFNVINHGDSWVNNLLFKFDAKGEFSDMIYVDFQNPRFGHPAVDLLYFIITSVHIDYKLKDFDYFIKYYHDQLIEHLQLLGYKKKLPKLRELQMGVYKYGALAVLASFVILPVVLLDPTSLATCENFLGGGVSSTDFKNLMFTNERYKTYIEQILPWLDNRGLLEPL